MIKPHDETSFNLMLRGALRSQGLSAFHIREADASGIADLLVYDRGHILSWLELKYEDIRFEPSQPGFLTKHMPLSKVAVYHTKPTWPHVDVYKWLGCRDDGVPRLDLVTSIQWENHRVAPWREILTVDSLGRSVVQ